MQEKSNRLTLQPLLLTFMLLIMLAVFIKSQQATLAEIPASAPQTVFSGERAFNLLQQLNPEQLPHPVDSNAGKAIEQRLVEQLRNMGYQPIIQQQQMCIDEARGSARCTQVRNVIVNIDAAEALKSAESGILLSAHYDSVMASAGGADDGVGVATLLEVARLLSMADKPKNRIVLLFNEGEEFGLFGAKAFMEHHPLAKGLQLALNVEARGSAGQSVLFETGENSGWLIKHYAQTSPLPVSNSLFYEVYKLLPNGTDLTVYKEYGLQGLNFANGDRVQHYHTPLDNLTNLDRGSLQHHGDNVWGVLNSIKDADLSKTPPGNLVYTDVMGLFVIHWAESASPWISAVLMALLIIAMVLLKQQQQLNIKQFAKGKLAVVIILISSAIAALLVQKLTQAFSGTHAPWHANALPMQIAVCSAVSLAGLLLAKWLSNKATPIDMTAALVAIWGGFGLASSVWVPGISYLFIIPTCAGIIGLFFMVWLTRQSSKNTSLPQVAILITLAIIAGISFLPIVYILEIMVTYQMAVAIGIFLGFVISALLPLTTLKAQSSTGFKQLIGAHALLLLLGIGWTSIQATYTAWMPQLLNLRYLQQDNGDAFILAGHRNNQLPDTLTAALTDITGNTGQLTAIYPWSRWQFHTVSAPSKHYPKPQLEILKTSIPEQGKTVTIKLSSSAEHLSGSKIYIPEAAGLLSIQNATQTISYQGENSSFKDHYVYHCRGLACAQMTLTLSFATDKAIKLQVATMLSVLPPDYQPLIQSRGESAVPYNDGDQSMILATFEL
ncbi:MAG: hypothetical protein ACI8WB_003293 [Phenylobacterium sp.]|jgi:hypothetical protein